MVNERVTTVILTGDETVIEFTQSYSYFWIKNIGSEEVYSSIKPDIVPEANGVYSVYSGDAVCVTCGEGSKRLYITGMGKVQVIGAYSAVCPFKTAGKGGGSSSITVDSALNNTSKNPVQNKVIDAAFNNITADLFSGNALGMELLKTSLQQNRALNMLKFESGTVTLTNSLLYPFNNSVKSVSLNQIRDTTDYTVEVEADALISGGIGRIVVTDKLKNGFKIAFTGGAASVTIKYTVRGGIL